NHHMPKTGGGARRRPFTSVVALAAVGVILLSSCTSNKAKEPAASTGSTVAGAAGGSSAPGKQVRIVFSGPLADHGFLAPINRFAKEQAAKYSDVTFTALEAAPDAP